MAGPPKNDRAAWLQGPSANCPSVPADTGRRWRLVLLGAPGVGKGTQAELLSERLGACHLSTGDVFRAAKQSGHYQTPAMKAALACMRKGELVPDATVWEMVRERSHCLLHCGSFILDGFPRTISQAESLQNLLAKEDLSLSAVINYELRVDEIILRLGGRRTCEKCKAVFHIKERPAKVEGVCDHCGAALHQREDDRPEAIVVRLQAYDKNTAPLIEFYKTLGLILPIAAQGTPEEICQRTIQKLNQR